jgi:hypothetical protein
MFPTTHDIHSGNVDAAIETIGLCLERGRRVLVVTKAEYAAVEAICRAFDSREVGPMFRFTVGAVTPEILARWEPEAPPLAERLEALRLACGMGYETSVSMEPLLEPENVEVLVNLVKPYVTDTIWIGTLRDMDARCAWWREQESSEPVRQMARLRAWQTPGGILHVWHVTRHIPGIRYKDSYREVLAAQGIRVEGHRGPWPRKGHPMKTMIEVDSLVADLLATRLPYQSSAEALLRFCGPARTCRGWPRSLTST